MTESNLYTFQHFHSKYCQKCHSIPLKKAQRLIKDPQIITTLMLEGVAPQSPEQMDPQIVHCTALSIDLLFRNV